MLAIMKDEFIEYAQEAEDEIFKRRIKKQQITCLLVIL